MEPNYLGKFLFLQLSLRYPQLVANILYLLDRFPQVSSPLSGFSVRNSSSLFITFIFLFGQLELICLDVKKSAGKWIENKFWWYLFLILLLEAYWTRIWTILLLRATGSFLNFFELLLMSYFWNVYTVVSCDGLDFEAGDDDIDSDFCFWCNNVEGLTFKRIKTCMLIVWSW